ncbi:MAG: 50S ribosomal protein L3 N(5)-glutamine methyltransferase [Alphaproteobacteria bacterium PRO2]|nr:50S ribosomal protein L3 N(5)-glutamine methyltransferase [Alphaproteobacteria bacterium PRO2]
MKTLGQVIENAAERFDEAGLVFGHGTDNSFDEAAFIAMEALGYPVDAVLEEIWPRELTKAEEENIESLVKTRIEKRIPAPYLFNKTYLQGLPFYVDERVIVPRSFIAELINHEDGFEPPGFPKQIKNVLDLCTGSGCLAILAAHVYPEAHIDAVELSPGAFEVAKRNVKEHGLEDCITLYNGDLFEPLEGKKYDLIITNPPYVDQAGMDDLPPEHKFEPEMALGLCGEDGLDIVRRIMEQAPAHLTEKGGLLCEIGRGKDNVEKAWPHLPFLWLETENSEGEVYWLRKKDFV